MTEVIAIDLSPWWARSSAVALVTLFVVAGYAFYRAAKWPSSFADVLDRA